MLIIIDYKAQIITDFKTAHRSVNAHATDVMRSITDYLNFCPSVRQTLSSLH